MDIIIINIKNIILYLNINILYNDVPKPWALYFQDSATPSFEGIIELHDQIMFYLITILMGVTYVMWTVIKLYNNNRNIIVYKYLNHGTFIELIWTITPALILVAIAFPSFRLLYLMDDSFDAALTIKVIGKQWFWSYEYTDFTNEDGESIEFDSYLIPEDDLEIGQLRQLETDAKVVLPIDTHIRFVVTGADVIHDFAIPSLGIKVDCNPGRLNQVSILIKREGYFYGQCSELCGVQHSSMPININAVNVEEFLNWLDQQI